MIIAPSAEICFSVFVRVGEAKFAKYINNAVLLSQEGKFIDTHVCV